MLKALGFLSSAVSYGLTFWAGGAFTLAWLMFGVSGGVTPAELMQASSWPVSYFHWLLN